MAQNQLLLFASGVGADILTFSQYQVLPARSAGFGTGEAVSTYVNTVWRQASFAAATLGQFTVDYSGQDVLDDGNVAVFEAAFVSALQQVAYANQFPLFLYLSNLTDS